MEMINEIILSSKDIAHERFVQKLIYEQPFWFEYQF